MTIARRSLRLPRRIGAVIVLVALFVLVANLTVLAGGRQRVLAPPADCALVLGAGVWPGGMPSPVLEDRLEEALTLYRAGEVKTLLVSGDHHRPEYDEPNTMRAWLEARGVPPEAIFMDHAGVDTYSSMWRARNVFGARSVVVVTQRFHLPRSLWVARALGIEARGAPADRRLYRGAIWFELRETVSRTKAVLDIAIHRKPRHVGPPIPLEQDGRVTAG